MDEDPRCFGQVDLFPVNEGDIMTRGNISGREVMYVVCCARVSISGTKRD
jgi:hypothetical protein